MLNKSHFTIDKMTLWLYGLYSILSILNSSLLNLEKIMSPITWGVLITAFILFIALGTTRYRKVGKKKIVLSILLVLLFTIAAIKTRRTYLILYSLFVLLGEVCDFRKIVLTSLISTLTALAIIFASIILGLIPNYSFFYSQREAKCFGFAYYSSVPYMLYYCFLSYIYLRGRKIKLPEILLILVVNYLVYKEATLRLTYYLTYISIALFIILQWNRHFSLNKKIIRMLSLTLFPLGAIITYYCASHYSRFDLRWAAINELFSGRLYYMNIGMQRYKASLFGNYIEMEGNSAIKKATDYFYIDSGFAYSLFGYGILFTLITIICYTIILHCSVIRNNKTLFVWCISILIFTMVNNTWVSLNYNPVLMATIPAFNAILKSKKVRERYKQITTNKSKAIQSIS